MCVFAAMFISLCIPRPLFSQYFFMWLSLYLFILNNSLCPFFHQAAVFIGEVLLCMNWAPVGDMVLVSILLLFLSSMKVRTYYPTFGSDLSSQLVASVYSDS